MPVNTPVIASASSPNPASRAAPWWRSGTWFALKQLVGRDFKSRYAGSALGLCWSIFQPIWQLLLFGFVFSTVLKVGPVGERTGSFAIFLFCGLLPWLAIHEGLLRAATAITDNAALVSKLRFPAELLVVTVVLASLLHEAIAAAVFLAVLAATEGVGWRGLPLLLIAVPLQVALTVGLGLVLAAVQVYVRDVAAGLGLLLTGWFYLTPIVYPLAYVPEAYQPWLQANPLTALVGLYRQAFLSGEWVLPPGTGTLALVAAGALVLGWWSFRRLSPAFADEL